MVQHFYSNDNYVCERAQKRFNIFHSNEVIRTTYADISENETDNIILDNNVYDNWNLDLIREEAVHDSNSAA